MTIAQETFQAPDVIFPPSDLYSDEPPLESDIHLQQIITLLESLNWLWTEKNDFYAAGNLTIYYSQNQLKSEEFRGPDFFVVLGTERKSRKSWVVWAENGQYPNVIIEIVSPSTASQDKNLKKEIYQDTFRTPNYFWFDPYNLELVGFDLVKGKYQQIAANERGHLLSEELGLYLGVNEGVLRFFTAEGELVLLPKETAKQEAQKTLQEAQKALQFQEEAQQEAQRANQAEQKAQEFQKIATQEAQRAQEFQERSERLAAKLRELNIDPDTI